MMTPIVDVTQPVALVGGAEVAPKVLNILQTLTDVVIAADGGADHLVAFGPNPSKVIGDLDSISEAARQKFASQLVHVRDQDSTDLEKVLQRVKAPVLIGAGFLGGRLDHTFAALSAVVRYPAQPLVLIDEVDCCFRCPDAGVVFALPIGTALSVLPMDSIQATTEGLQWDMKGLALKPAGAVSSSNRTAAAEVHIAVTGPAIITLPLAQLPHAIDAVRAR
ncbi:MAG: thiamine diphosphokinase [Pseudomonadota bacterium]